MVKFLFPPLVTVNEVVSSGYHGENNQIFFLGGGLSGVCWSLAAHNQKEVWSTQLSHLKHAWVGVVWMSAVRAFQRGWGHDSESSVSSGPKVRGRAWGTASRPVSNRAGVEASVGEAGGSDWKPAKEEGGVVGTCCQRSAWERLLEAELLGF